jgi:hypothetical protein
MDRCCAQRYLEARAHEADLFGEPESCSRSPGNSQMRGRYSWNVYESGFKSLSALLIGPGLLAELLPELAFIACFALRESDPH